MNNVITQISNAISQGSSISLSATIAGKIFSQIKYFDIDYSQEVQEALLTWESSFVSLGLTPDLPNSFLDKIPERDVPSIFQKYDVPASFLINFWENLGVIIFAFVLWILFKIIESNASSPKIVSVARRARIMAQNFLIASLFGVYGDLVLFSLLEYRTFVFGWNLSFLSLLISVIFLIVMIATFIYQIRLLIDYQKIKKSSCSALEKFTEKHEGSQVLFEEFKDDSLWPQMFTFFLSARDLLLSIILATMFAHPLAQNIIIFLMNCCFIAYLLIKRPFQSTFNLIQQLFFEIMGLIVNFAIMINSNLDSTKSQTRHNIGKLIIAMNLIFNFVTLVFMLICVFQTLREFYKQYKERQAVKSRKAINICLRNLPQGQSSLDFSQISPEKSGFIHSDQSLINVDPTNRMASETSILGSGHGNRNFNFHLPPPPIKQTGRRALQNSIFPQESLASQESMHYSHNNNQRGNRRNMLGFNEDTLQVESNILPIPRIVHRRKVRVAREYGPQIFPDIQEENQRNNNQRFEFGNAYQSQNQRIQGRPRIRNSQEFSGNLQKDWNL